MNLSHFQFSITYSMLIYGKLRVWVVWVCASYICVCMRACMRVCVCTYTVYMLTQYQHKPKLLLCVRTGTIKMFQCISIIMYKFFWMCGCIYIYIFVHHTCVCVCAMCMRVCVPACVCAYTVHMLARYQHKPKVLLCVCTKGYHN